MPIYLRPGSGTGTGTLADPYYWNQRTTAETAAGNGGTLILLPGIYGWGNGSSTPNQGNLQLTYRGLYRHGTSMYHSGHDVFKTGTTARMDFKWVEIRIGNPTYNYRNFGTNIYFDQCTIYSNSTDRSADHGAGYTYFKEIKNSLILNNRTSSTNMFKSGVHIVNSTYICENIDADISNSSVKMTNVLLYSKVASHESPNRISTSSSNVWAYNFTNMVTGSPAQCIGHSDPFLADPSNDRYRPKTGSPLWEAGVIV